MNQEDSVIRCPVCGSVNLTAYYDNQASKKIAKGGLMFGVLGLIVSFVKNKNAASTFWECQSCGHRFLMK
ncbi:MAG: hypothetical protein MJ194_02995 [Clostridia bacterium]|nr:hypothetical protein [Clostridia bacterium]